MTQPADGGDAGLPLKMLQAIYNALASLQQEVRQPKEDVEIQSRILMFQQANPNAILSPSPGGNFVLPSSRMAEQFRKGVANTSAEKPPSEDSPKEKKK